MLVVVPFLLAIVLSVLCWFTASYFSSCIFKLFFWLLSCLSVVDLRILTSPLVSSNFSFGYCPVCPSLIYGFLLLLLYLQTFLLAIVLSVLRWFTASYFSSSIFKLFFWLLSCLSFVDVRILTSPLVSSNFSFGYCPICPSLIYGFLFPLLYLQTFLVAIVLSVLCSFTASYFSCIFRLFFWLLSCLSVVALGFLLLLLHLQTFLLAIVLSVLCWFTDSYFSSCIFKLFFWLLSCLSFVDLRLLTSPLLSSNFSFGYCPVCPLLIYGFLHLLLYLQTFLLAIVLSVLRWFTASYFSCIFKLFFWLLSCLSFVDLRILTSPLVSSNFSFDYCPVCPSLIYVFLLLLFYLQTFLLAIVLSVLCWFTASYISSCICRLFFWLLSSLSFVDLRLLTSLVSSNFSFGCCPVCPSLIYGFLHLLLYLQLFFGYCPVCPSLIYGLLLLLLYLQTFLLTIVLSVRRWFTDSYISSCIFRLFFWLLSCLSVVDLRILTSPLVSSDFSFGYCPVCPSLIYGFLLLLLYLQTFLLAIVRSVRRWFTDSYISSCIFRLFFWLLSCLSFVDLRILTSPLVSSNFSFGYCSVCPSLIYGFLLHLLYLQTFLLAIVLYVRRWFTDSYFTSCIFKLFCWLLSCLSFVDLRLLTSPLVSSDFSFGYCPVCPSLIYGFLLHLLYLQTFLLTIVLSVICWFTASYISSCIFRLFFWLLSCLSFVDLRFLLLLYLQTFLLAVVLSVLRWFTDSYFTSCIFKLFFWLLSCLSFVDLRFLLLLYLQTFLLAIVLSVLRWFTDSYFTSCIFNFSFGYCPVCPSLIYGFLHLRLYLQTFLLAIVLSVRRWFTDSYISSCIFRLFFWLLSCLSVVDLRILTSPLVSSDFSFGYCPVCPSLIYGFLHLLLYLQTFLLAIVLSVLRWFTDSYFSSCIFKLFIWLLFCLSFVDLRILTSPLVSSDFSFGYCPVCSSLIYGFLLHLLYLQTFLLAIVLSVLRWFTASYFSSCIFRLFFWLLSCLSVLRWFTDSYFTSCIFKLFFWLLSCLSFVDLRLLTSLVSSNFSVGCCPVCPSLIYGFLLHLLYLQTFLLTIVLSVLRWFTASYFSSCIFKLFFWLLSCLSVVDLWILTSPLVSSNFSFGYCPVCPSLIYGFLLLLLYLQTFHLAIVLSVLRWFTDSYFTSCIFKLFFWLLSCMFVVDLRLLTSPLVSSDFSFGYCPVCPSLIYGFLLLLLYLQTFHLAIVLSVLRWFMDSYFTSCIFKLFFWLLSCMFVVDLRLLTSPLVSSNFSFGYCPICSSLIYGFLLHLLYLQTFLLTIVLSVLCWFTASYISSCIFRLFLWLLSCLSFVDLRLLTSLVSSNFSFGCCPVCPSLTYGFLLLLYLQTFLLAIVMSVLRWFTASYFSCIFNFSFGYCPVCPSLIYGFLLHLLYLQTFLLTVVLSVLRWLTASYFSCIFKLFFWLLSCLSFVDLRFLLLLYLQLFFWLLSCLSVVDLRLLTSHLVSSDFSFGYCPVCPSLINGFLLLLLYLQTFHLAIVLSVLRWFTASYIFSCIFKLFFWLLSCLSVFDLRILTSPLVSSNLSFNSIQFNYSNLSDLIQAMFNICST